MNHEDFWSPFLNARTSNYSKPVPNVEITMKNKNKGPDIDFWGGFARFRIKK